MKLSSSYALATFFVFALAIPMFAVGEAYAAPHGGSVGHAPVSSMMPRASHRVSPIQPMRIDHRAGRFRRLFVADGGYADYSAPSSYYGPTFSQEFVSAPSVSQTTTIVHVADDAPDRPIGPLPCVGPKIIELGAPSKSRAASPRVIRGGGVSCTVGGASGGPGIYSVN